MASAINNFIMDRHGLLAPCRLFLAKEDQEIVRFPEGLKGKAIFAEHFTSYVQPFKRYGINCSLDASLPESLRSKGIVYLNDDLFGEAFYRVYFPQMRKHDPKNYVWEVLEA